MKDIYDEGLLLADLGQRVFCPTIQCPICDGMVTGIMYDPDQPQDGFDGSVRCERCYWSAYRSGIQHTGVIERLHTEAHPADLLIHEIEGGRAD